MSVIQFWVVLYRNWLRSGSHARGCERLRADSRLSGSLEGTGAHAFTLRLTNTRGDWAEVPVTWTINARPTALAVPTAPALNQNVAIAPISFTASDTSGGLSWSLSGGSLPTGLSLSSAGMVVGTPVAGGSFSFTARVTDAEGAFTEVARSWTVNPAPVFAGHPTSTAATRFVATTVSIGASDSDGVSYGASLSGPGREGESLNQGAGQFTFTPVDTGTYTLTVTATDALGARATRSVTITVTGGRTLVDAGGFRRWSDGTVAPDCNGYRAPAANSGSSWAYSAAQLRTDGLYQVRSAAGSTLTVYCEMDLDGGGRTLVGRTAPGSAISFGWRCSDSGSPASGAYCIGTHVHFAYTREFMVTQLSGATTVGDYAFKSGIMPANWVNSYTHADHPGVRSVVQQPSNMYPGLSGQSYPSMQALAGFTNENHFYLRDCCGRAGYGLFAGGMVTFYCPGNNPFGSERVRAAVAGPWCGSDGWMPGSSTNQGMMFVR